MKMKCKNIIAVLLAALFCVSAAACGKDTPSVTTPDAQTSTSTPASTEPEVPAEYIVISDGKAVAPIVRADECSDIMKNNAINLNNRVKRFTSVTPGIKTDWVKRGDEPDNDSFEILIGETNRQATKDLLASLPEHSYGIRVIGNKLVICGTSENMTSVALYAFENRVLLNKEYCSSGKLVIPADLDIVFTSEKLDSRDGILTSPYAVQALISNPVSIPKRDSYNAAQGAATDGKYFYNIIINGNASPQVGIIVKTSMETGKEVAVSGEIPTDHGNDMCYNSKENLLVLVNMVGKTITMVDPENLTVVKQVEANELPGTPYGIAYNEESDCYIILAGGRYNFVTSDFKLLRNYAMISHKYMGQGMDADDQYVYIPGSPYPEKGTTQNIIHVYDWGGTMLKAVALETGTESETMLNYGGKYYINFNTSSARINDISYCIVYK